MTEETAKFASLSSGLLARKGGARPAMRRPNSLNGPSLSAVNNGSLDNDIDEDCGWNDMGHDESSEDASHGSLSSLFPAYGGEVHRQQAELAESFGQVSEPEAEAESEADPEAETIEQDPVVEPAKPEQKAEPEQRAAPEHNPEPVDPEAVLAPVRRELHLRDKKLRRQRKTRKAKTAFTLRLDEERHLRLRLACAMYDISAQKLLIQALDELLDANPDIDQLAGRLSR